ncbi:HEAT repeat domain-containing protein [Geothrix fuzhouensis]|uniref:HEAT repeat domain-containing protein n=1 Tax=Geothrix fuzhouensis TaxID=2966451 RepID=UPI00214974E1|nr:HEAT repeat domain-containing protein [Geothrix fuzhouensis]
MALLLRLDGLPLEKPSPTLRNRFYQALEQAAEAPHPRSGHPWKLLPQAAAAALLLGGGFLGGYLAHGGSDITSLARGSDFTLLHQGGPSLRMAGIMLASQGDSEDPAPAEAMLDLLDKDPSESVRLAAVDALYLFGRQPKVREHLIASLPRQTSTRVQLALVDLLGALREQRALDALKTLLHAPGTDPQVVRRVQTQLEGRSL